MLGFISILAITSIFIGNVQANSNFGFSEEFCNSETFEPRCQNDEIVVVDEAVYGRRKLGRCLQDEVDLNEVNIKDPKFIGCFSDVRNLVEPKCLGKSSCQVRVAELKTISGCYTYLKCFMEVTFRCLKVVQDNRHCGIKLDTERQHLLSSRKSNSGCGLNHQPWIIESTKGQKISITFDILDANNSGHISVVQDKYGCKNPVGFVVEKTSRTNKTICYRQDKQMKMSFLQSESNSIEIVFMFNKDQNNAEMQKQLFIVNVEAIGCSDLIPPADAWLKRTENEAIIGCYSTRLRWQLKCQGQRWIGVIGNCSYAPREEFEIKPISSPIEKSNNQVVMVFAIVILGIVLCLFIACFGIVCLKRYYAISKSKAVMKQVSMENKLTPNETFLSTSPKDYYGLTDYKNTLPQDDFHILNGLTNITEEPAQYFELDQSLALKQLPANVN